MDFWRQLDIVSPKELDFYVTLIGCGGIGSTTAMCLAKMGVSKIRLYDSDGVSLHNLPNSFFKDENLNGNKAVEIACNMAEYATPNNFHPIGTSFDGENFTPVMISGVDSMRSRHEIWQKMKFNSRVHLYIDGRMGGQTGIVYAVRPCDPEHIKAYENTLYFTDEEAVQEACTNRAIIYNTFMIAALIAHSVRCYAVGDSIPFERIFDFPTNLYMVK